jgi:YfiH family protein
MVRDSSGGIPLWRFALLSSAGGLRHAITTRLGGTSEPPYAELNLGLHVGDDPGRVVENRRRVCQALGVSFESLTFGRQVHGDRVHVVGSGDVGAGRDRLETSIAGADGLVVAGSGATIGVLMADCVPLVCYDPERRVGAVAHAGWRGTARGIAAAMVGRMARECGSRPEWLLVGIGPGVGPCCYEVGGEVVEALRAAGASPGSLVAAGEGSWRVDLAAVNCSQLMAAGVPAGNIEVAGICTSCRSEEFFSERRLGRPTGRFGAFLALA